jgi:hypothetical protein
MSRVRIFDKSGAAIAEPGVDVWRSWRLNAYGRASFTLPANHPAARPEILAFGNYLLVEHDTLPTWGGVIDTPRRWGKMTVQVNACSAERILEWRRGPHLLLARNTPGGLFRRILQAANQQGDTRISEGEIFSGGTARDETLSLFNLYGEICRLAADYGNDWEIEAQINSAGRLSFLANWYARRGLRRDLALQEGVNIELSGLILREGAPDGGDIVNDLLGYGSGIKWENRYHYQRTDEESISQYGLRQGRRQFPENEPAVIQAATRQHLRLAAQPRNLFHFHALDVGETFANLRPGDSLPLRLYSAGFLDGGVGTQTRVRVNAMEYTDARPALALECVEDE